METLVKLLEGLKLPTRYIVAIAMFTAALLFFPPPWIQFLGLEAIVTTHRAWISGTFLLCVSICLVVGSLKAWQRIDTKRLNASRLANGKRRLNNLTHWEQSFLANYVRGKTRTITDKRESGIIQDLVRDGIVYLGSEHGRNDGYDFNIHPWVYEYLLAHPECIGLKQPAKPQ